MKPEEAGESAGLEKLNRALAGDPKAAGLEEMGWVGRGPLAVAGGKPLILQPVNSSGDRLAIEFEFAMRTSKEGWKVGLAFGAGTPEGADAAPNVVVLGWKPLQILLRRHLAPDEFNQVWPIGKLRPNFRDPLVQRLLRKPAVQRALVSYRRENLFPMVFNEVDDFAVFFNASGDDPSRWVPFAEMTVLGKQDKGSAAAVSFATDPAVQIFQERSRKIPPPAAETAGLEESLPTPKELLSARFAPQEVWVAVVEDMELVRGLIIRRVRSRLEGVVDPEHVVGFGEVSPAAEWIAKNRPQLVITDRDLPDGDGFSVARDAKEANPMAAVVLQSGRDLEDLPEAQEMLRRGVLAEFIPKPFRGERIQSVTERYIVRRLSAGLEEIPALLRFTPSSVQRWQVHIFDPENADVGRLAAALITDPVVIIARDERQERALRDSGFVGDGRIVVRLDLRGNDIREAREFAAGLFRELFEPLYYTIERRQDLLVWLAGILERYNIPDSILSLGQAQKLMRSLEVLRAA